MHSGPQPNPIAASLSIEPFEVSRWRLRRTRLRQPQGLLNAPDTGTKKGLRDRVMLAILLGCRLRRSEVAALTLPHIQQRDNRWCIID